MPISLDINPAATPDSAAGEILSRNLERLGQRNADLARAIAAAAPRTDLTFDDTPQGVPSIALAGRPLCSRHRPLDEARRLVDDIDIVEHAVIVVFGFAAGYHVQRLAERMQRTGVIVVFEPDLGLLRAVLQRIDITNWLETSNIVWITDPDDRASLASKLDGAESILAQGVEFIEHPASRQRLGAAPAQFSEMFTSYISTAKTTLMTTLMRSVDTVRNLLHNIDHYVTAGGVADLAGVCAGSPAVIVSAGPSLHRSLKLLAQPGVRDRCIIIAVQTTLQPLLDAGIRPHFVTALDYHEISRRFYEQLNPEDVADVTLIAEPKAHPVILDAYPGPVRCCASSFLDDVLGEQHRDMGSLRAGATVAHLALYVAEHLGCNPIAMVGQDLGFTDGLYYAPGIAIEDVWAPELGPFNTMEMMQWQRIARHRVHLHKTTDSRGRTIYSDAQMLAYLRQFERDFAALSEKGISVIDATGGGLPKQHAVEQPLDEFLNTHASKPITRPPLPAAMSDEQRREQARARTVRIRQEAGALHHYATRAGTLLQKMMDDQHDPAKMDRHFAQMEKYRREVDQRSETFALLNHVNQLGVFKRLKADRRLHLSAELSAIERQRAELDRDLENVRWIADAAEEFQRQLDDAARTLAGEHVPFRPAPVKIDEPDNDDTAATECDSRIAALIPVDPNRNGLLRQRSIDTTVNGSNVLQRTLERLSASKKLHSIVLLVPDGFDPNELIHADRIGLPIAIEHCGDSPYPAEHEAIAAARAWSESCWRGGIAGISAYDELLCPQVMHDVMTRRGFTAALLVGPDWPLVDVAGEHGCDAVIQRHRDYPKQNSIVFTQAPPGLCGCVVSAREMESLSRRNRLATIGGRLTYQPSAPQADPIAKDLNVQIEHNVRSSLMRLTADTPNRVKLIETALRELEGKRNAPATSSMYIKHCQQLIDQQHAAAPDHLIVELTTSRTSSGHFAMHPFGAIERPDLEPDALQSMLAQFNGDIPAAITFDGVGDPLRHPRFDDCVRIAKDSGIRAVHVRTELLGDNYTIDRLLDSPVDVISVDLHADRAATYQSMMGFDGFKQVLQTMDDLLARRRRLTDQPGLSAMALPWVVARLQRCPATYEDIDSFYDRWQHTLGTAVIEGRPLFNADGDTTDDDLLPAVTPRKIVHRELQRRMTIYCDGSVPIDELDLPGGNCVGNAFASDVHALWRNLLEARRLRLDELNLFRP